MANDEQREIIAVVDDDEVTRRMLGLALKSAGFDVVAQARGEDAIRILPSVAHAVCLDLGLEDIPGMDVLQHLRARNPDLAVVVTSRADLATAVEAMRLGASDYLVKPVAADRLVASLRNVLAARAERRRARARPRFEPRGMIGRSEPMRELSRLISHVLESDVTVCILGESGSGKELVARALHDGGKRAGKPFVAINCGAIPATLHESELFGHERGAFTGATGQHRGRFEQAHGGTLFLDEIGEMSAGTQAALLRTLQERTIRRVGGTGDIPVDVRVVCATHRDLAAEVSAGRFREDLYFRLVVYPIRVPPLRERLDDVPLLVGHFLGVHARDVQRGRRPHERSGAGARGEGRRAPGRYPQSRGDPAAHDRSRDPRLARPHRKGSAPARDRACHPLSSSRGERRTAGRLSAAGRRTIGWRLVAGCDRGRARRALRGGRGRKGRG